MSGDGGFLIAWESNGQGGASSGVYAQRFDATGGREGGEAQVNSYTTGGQPAVGMSSDGTFVIAWVGNGEIVARPFSETGDPSNAEFRVNTHTVNQQTTPKVAMSDAGTSLVVWTSQSQDGQLAGIFAQRFALPVVLDIDGDGSTEALTDGLLVLRYHFGFKGATLISGAVAVGCTRCTPEAILSYLQSLD
jgi:hypothetical protein